MFFHAFVIFTLSLVPFPLFFPIPPSTSSLFSLTLLADSFLLFAFPLCHPLPFLSVILCLYFLSSSFCFCRIDFLSRSKKDVLVSPFSPQADDLRPWLPTLPS